MLSIKKKLVPVLYIKWYHNTLNPMYLFSFKKCEWNKIPPIKFNFVASNTLYRATSISIFGLVEIIFKMRNFP